MAIAEALTVMGGHLDANKKDRIVVVTESLGSTITLNTVNQMLADKMAPGPDGSPATASSGDGSFRLRHTRFPLVDDDLASYTAKLREVKVNDKSSEFDKLRIEQGIPNFVKNLEAKGRWQKQALLKLGNYIQEKKARDKVLFFMFANQFGLIEAGAGRDAQWRIEDFSQSFRDLSRVMARDNSIEFPPSPTSDSEYSGVLEAFQNFAKLVEEKGEAIAMAKLRKHITHLTPPYYNQVGKLDEQDKNKRGQFDVDSLQIVSFYDPNDLLGYPLPSRSKRGGVAIPVKNIYVDNGGKRGGYRLGDRDFRVCDPGRAHTGGYQRNDRVFDKMWEMKETLPAPANP